MDAHQKLALLAEDLAVGFSQSHCSPQSAAALRRMVPGVCYVG